MSTIISSNLKRFQRQKELSIPKLAEQSGVSVRTIERIRTGKHVPDLDTIKKLAKALGQKPEHLVEGAVRKIADWEGKEVFESNELKPSKVELDAARIEYAFTEARKELLKMKENIRKANEMYQDLFKKDFTKFEREFYEKKLAEAKRRLELAKKVYKWVVRIWIVGISTFILYTLFQILS